MAVGTVAMSLEEYLSREETDRAEWADGQLILVSPPATSHQWAARRLVDVLGAACPKGYVPLEAVSWRLEPNGPVRVPDVAVLPRAQLLAGELLTEPPLLVIEVLSPHENPEEKLDEYARAGLVHHWTFYPRTRALTVYRAATRGPLVARMEVVGRFWPGEEVRLEDPFPIAFDPAELTL